MSQTNADFDDDYGYDASSIGFDIHCRNNQTKFDLRKSPCVRPVGYTGKLGT